MKKTIYCHFYCLSHVIPERQVWCVKYFTFYLKITSPQKNRYSKARRITKWLIK